jgi:Flp pilus assembly pilin Flp
MKQLKAICKKFFSEESGQGMAEYILLLVIVIAAVMAFKQPILDALKSKTDKVTGDINSF